MLFHKTGKKKMKNNINYTAPGDDKQEIFANKPNYSTADLDERDRTRNFEKIKKIKKINSDFLPLYAYGISIMTKDHYTFCKARTKDEAALIVCAVNSFEAMKKALNRQCDNMTFAFNHMEVHQFYEKFTKELDEDRVVRAFSLAFVLAFTLANKENK